MPMIWSSTLTINHSPVRFDDPLLYHHASRCDPVNLNAYLVALAAWQRGLEVVFHYEVVSKCERFARLPAQGYRGELFSVSDGTSTHYFCRSQGDGTTREASALCEDKHATKARLREHGIDVPAGIKVTATHPSRVDAFLSRYPSQRFILKPLSGTLGRGVHRQLTAKDVTRLLPTLTGEHLLEESIEGPEYRIHVVDGRCVAALQRVAANIVGDGRQTLATLMERKQTHRARHPVYRESPLPAQALMHAFLAEHGHHLNEVPEQGERVWLSDIPSFTAGGELVDVTSSLPAHVAALVVRVQAALGLPNTGLDLIVQHPGNHNERIVILEANQNPYIHPDAIAFPGVHPGGGNRIAEALIDTYFPASADTTRHPRASFDMRAVVQTLQSATVGEVALPVIGPGWVHQRISLAAVQVGDQTRSRLQRLIFSLGIHAQLIQRDTGDLLIDVIAPKTRLTAFMQHLQGRAKRKVR